MKYLVTLNGIFRSAMPIKIVVLLLLFSAVNSACTLDIDTSATNCETEIFIVNRFDDLTTGACNDQCTLRDAVIDANTCAGPDTIELGEGTYTLSIRGPGEKRGDLNITDDVDIRTEDPSSTEITTIQGDDRWNDRIFSIDVGVDLNLYGGFLLTGGSVADRNGGAIENYGDLYLDKVRIENNIAGGFGGGIYNAGILRSFFLQLINNTAAEIPDTGLFNADDNEEYCGGGIANVGVIELGSSVIISENRAFRGGGICNIGSGDSYVAFNEGDITDNHSFYGGGVYSRANLEIIGSNITDNLAGAGGGVFIEGGVASISGSTIEGNRVLLGRPTVGYTRPFPLGCGGGILIDHENGDDLSIVDNIISANIAQRGGGGICIRYTEGRENFQRNAVVNNLVTDGDGGGLYAKGGE